MVGRGGKVILSLCATAVAAARGLPTLDSVHFLSPLEQGTKKGR